MEEENVRKRTISGQREKRLDDPDYDAKKKKVAAAKKAEYRNKLKTDNKEYNDQTTVKTIKPQSTPNKSRQAFAGLVIRKKQNKEKNETIDSLKTENIELKKELEKLETNLFNMDLENKELKHENTKKEDASFTLKI